MVYKPTVTHPSTKQSQCGVSSLIGQWTEQVNAMLRYQIKVTVHVMLRLLPVRHPSSHLSVNPAWPPSSKTKKKTNINQNLSE